MTNKVSDIKSGKKADPVCKHCAKVPQSEHPFYSCPRLAGVHEYEDSTGYEYVQTLQTYAVEVTHRVTSEPAPQGDDETEPNA
jgi:hypothetical protein